MRSKNHPPKATFESVWAAMQENVQILKENERERKEYERLLKEAAVFKQLFPQYANFDLYLGLAALHFEEDAEKEAISNGIAIIKQVGENMVIYDGHLRVFGN